ncbi:hypothetical protein PanWU01x14_035130, partial [Parasponia andersonii]
ALEYITKSRQSVGCAHLCGKKTHGQCEPYLPNADRLSNVPDKSHSTMLSPGSR